MSVRNNAAEEVDIDLGRLFGSILEKWPHILAGALIVAGLALAFALVSTPKYKAESRVEIRQDESPFTRPTNSSERDDRNSPMLDEEGVSTQVQVILSDDVLMKVVKDPRLGLLDRGEYSDARLTSSLSRLLALVGVGGEAEGTLREERVLEALRENITVYRLEKTRMIAIQAKSESADLATSIANTIADTYVDTNRAGKVATDTGAAEFLEPEIQRLTARVKDAEAKVAEYRAQSDLLLGQNNSVLATQQLSELSQELTRVRAARAAAESDAEGVRRALREGASMEALPEVLSSPLIQRLRERQVQLKADIADLSTTLLDNHPRIKALKSQLTGFESQMRAEARNVLAALTTKAETAKVREQQLTSELNRLKAESARAGDEEVNLRALEREAASQRDLLNSYLLRYREASARKDRLDAPADARAFHAGKPLEPYFPKIVPIVGAGFAGGLILMILSTMMGELFSGRAMRMAPAERRDHAGEEPAEDVFAPATAPPFTAFAARPEPAGEPEPVAPPASPYGDIGVDAAAERLIEQGATRALFISPEGDEAAASAVLVARRLADKGLRVLLLDLTSGGAASLPMVEDSHLPGITNLLAAEAQFTEIIHSDLYSEAQVIPAGDANPHLAMKAIDRLPMIMDALGSAYDIVIVECGPAEAASLQRLAGDGAHINISVLNPGEQAITDLAADLEQAGYRDFALVTPAGYAPAPPTPGRSAA